MNTISRIKCCFVPLFTAFFFLLTSVCASAEGGSLNMELETVSTSLEEVVKGNFAKIIILLSVVFMGIGLASGWNTRLVLGAAGTAIAVALFPNLLMGFLSAFGG